MNLKFLLNPISSTSELPIPVIPHGESSEEKKSSFLTAIEEAWLIDQSADVKLEYKKRSWTKKEDQKLTTLVQLYPSGWSKIAAELENRGALECRNHWDSINSNLKKGKWDKEENQKFLNLVKIYPNNWALISREMGNRSLQQCYQHWFRVMDPKIIKKDWTNEEDQKLIELVKIHQTNWKEIVKEFPGRHSGQCHQRWNSYLNPNINKNEWSVEEDQKLFQIIQKIGKGNWVEVANELGNGRTNYQCKMRFKVMKIVVKKEPIPLLAKRLCSYSERPGKIQKLNEVSL